MNLSEGSLLYRLRSRRGCAGIPAQ